MSLLNNWKKDAEAQINKAEIERSFMDQAFAFIQNKAGRLLSDPHRLGFEIVYRNDSNTRLVGIFAFRAGKRLLYAPVFFINGEIKGTDLLYEQDRKLFKPLTEEQVDFMLEAHSLDEGKGFKNDDLMRRDMDLGALAEPGRNRSYQKMAEEMAKVAELKPILGRFIRETGGREIIARLGAAASRCEKFARALAKLPDDEWAPLDLPDTEKSAAAEWQETEDDLLFFDRVEDGVKSAAAMEDLSARGYGFIDKRAYENVNMVELSDAEIQSVSESGVYRIIGAGGKLEKALCLVGSDSGLYAYDNLSEGRLEKSPEVTVVYEDGTVTRARDNRVYALSGEPADDPADFKRADKTPKTGQVYLVYNPKDGRILTGKIVEKVKEREDVSSWRFSQYEHDRSVLTVTDACQDTNWDSGHDHVSVGPDTLFIRVKAAPGGYSAEPGAPAGSEQDLTHALLSAGLVQSKLACVKRVGRERYDLFTTGRVVSNLSEKQAAIKLARDLRLPADQAIELVSRAKADGETLFWMDLKSMEKSGAMRMMQEPDFEQGFDQEHGVRQEGPVRMALRVSRRDQEIEPPRMGDRFKPEGFSGLPIEQLLGSAPEELAELQRLEKIPHLFDHGIVGSLAKTFDAVAMIDRYLPDLEQAVDVLGRALFLFYWKPGEFQDAYGVDDMQNLEDEILSNFKQLGALTLSLLKRSPKAQTGAAAISPNA